MRYDALSRKSYSTSLQKPFNTTTWQTAERHPTIDDRYQKRLPQRTRRILPHGKQARIRRHHSGMLKLLLTALSIAKRPDDMNVPRWKLHSLAGDLSGCCRILAGIPSHALQGTERQERGHCGHGFASCRVAGEDYFEIGLQNQALLKSGGTSGVPLGTRRVLLGHKNGDITTLYSAAEVAELLDAANRVCEQGSRKSPAITLPKRKIA